MEAQDMQTEMPLRSITPEEGLALVKEAFKRGEDPDFQSFLLDRITDPIQKRVYAPIAKLGDPGRRRLHPILVSGLVCFGLLFAVFVYFSYWR